MAETTPQSSVRNRKVPHTQATQRFLPIAEIRNDTVILKNGGIRAIISVEALNFNLKSETEQAGIIAGYGQFVNTLTFPIQIFIRSMKTNIDEYLAGLRTVADGHSNELLKNQTFSYINFMQKLLDVADIMQKRFYMVIPVDRNVRKKTMIEKFFDWINPDDTQAKSAYRSRELNRGLKDLNERVELVTAGLTTIGLRAKRLTTRELLELYYQIYNPKTSQREKIPSDMSELKLEKTVF
jgi:hypothetical protein